MVYRSNQRSYPTAHIDGVNAGQQAKDSQIIEQVIKDNEKLPIDMSRGGGYTGIIHIEK